MKDQLFFICQLVLLLNFCVSSAQSQDSSPDVQERDNRFKWELGFGTIGDSENGNTSFVPALLYAGYRFGKNEMGARLVAGKEFRICFGSCSSPADSYREFGLLYGRTWSWKKLEGVFYSGLSFVKIKRNKVFNYQTNTYSNPVSNSIKVPLGTNIYVKFTEGFGLGVGSYFLLGGSVSGGGTASLLFLIDG